MGFPVRAQALFINPAKTKPQPGKHETSTRQTLHIEDDDDYDGI